MPAAAQLSECALRYATAICEPWSPHAEGACIPKHPSRPSHKVKTFNRFTVTIGTQGIGGVYVMPCLCSDTANAYATMANFTGTSLTNLSAITTGVLTVLNNGMYTSASFGAGSAVAQPAVQGRMVSVGLTYEYTGTVMDMGGLSYSLIHPNHGNLNPAGTASSLGAYAECVVQRVGQKKQYLVTSSIETPETEYYNAANTAVGGINYVNACYPYSAGTQFSASDVVGGAPMCIIFTGKAGNTFEVELVQHCEYVGSATQAVVTPTHGDSKGFEIVAAASAKLPGLKAASPSASMGKLMSTALTGVLNGLRPAAGAIGQGAGAALGALAGSYFGVPGFGATAGRYAGNMISDRTLGSRSGQLLLTNG